MKRHFLFLLLTALCCMAGFAQDNTAKEKPLMTIACLSDVHNELGLISGDVSTVRLRGTFVNTLHRIHDEEDVDLVCLGGDYTSDVTINRGNWLRVKALMREATRSAFKEGRTRRPVIYVTGNHDYEVANFDHLPKDYNAADYRDLMEEGLGRMADSDTYYETADNGTGTPQRLLAAFHTEVKGFDFVVLNCGLYFFHSAWDYTYSEGSVRWVADKLKTLYADDPDRTVFFLLHVPFRDSNSLSAARKGMNECAATTLLKQTLSAYPNVIMLYGHDHGTDSAYVRTKTSQRVTRYDTAGSVIATTDATHVDECGHGCCGSATPPSCSGEAAKAISSLSAVDATGSFFSSFMGSMRYYENSIEGDVSVSNSKIVQALMVYIYPDRITLKMKNYGQSGTFGAITINPDLAAYTVYRPVHNAHGPVSSAK